MKIKSKAMFSMTVCNEIAGHIVDVLWQELRHFDAPPITTLAAGGLDRVVPDNCPEPGRRHNHTLTKAAKASGLHARDSTSDARDGQGVPEPWPGRIAHLIEFGHVSRSGKDVPVDPFGFLRPWGELPALIGSAPPATCPSTGTGVGTPLME